MARLSLLTETFPPEVNGVSFTLARLARGLTQLGDQVEVICPERTSTNNLDENWSEFYIPSRKIPGYDDLRFGLLCKNLSSIIGERIHLLWSILLRRVLLDIPPCGHVSNLAFLAYLAFTLILISISSIIAYLFSNPWSIDILFGFTTKLR